MKITRLLNLSFKLSFILVLLAFNATAQKEEVTSENDTLTKPAKFRFHFDVGFVAGWNATGDNYISEGYDLSPGIDLSTTILYNKVTFHFDVQAYGGDVVNQELVGAIADSRISRTSLGIGYHIKWDSDFSLNPSINYGSISYRSNLPDSADFKDEGEFLSLEIKALYEVSPTFAFYLGLAYYQDFMEIETASSQADFYQNISHFNPSIGIRFSTRAIKRKPGEPGDGIFSRKDGL